MTAAAARKAEALERSGSIDVGGGRQPARGDGPAARLGVVDRRAGLAQHRDGHGQMRRRRHPAAGGADGRAPRRSAGRRAAGPRSAGWRRLASTSSAPPRSRPVAVMVNGMRGRRQGMPAPERAQRLEQGAERALAHPRVTVDRHRAAGEHGGRRGKEAGDRAGIARSRRSPRRPPRARARPVTTHCRAARRLVDPRAEPA